MQKTCSKAKIAKAIQFGEQVSGYGESTRMPEKGKHGLKHNGFSTREARQTPCTVSILCI